MSTMRRLGLVLGSVALTLLAGCVFSTPSFSPDGKRIAIANERDLIIMNVDGSGKVRVPGAKSTLLPMWSPDGRYVAYYGGSKRDGAGWAQVYDTRDGRTRRLRKDAIPVAWREDGKRLALIGGGSNQPGWVDLYSLPGSCVVQRIDIPAEVTPTVIDFPFYWVPGTDNLAFLGDHSGRPGGRDVYLAESGEVRQVTHTGDVIGLAVSRDGRWLAWARFKAGKSRLLVALWQYDLGKRDARQVGIPGPMDTVGREAAIPRAVKAACFSPDLRRIARTVDGRNGQECWVIESDGTHARRLSLPGANWSGILPAWSADGAQLAVQCGEYNDQGKRKFTTLGTFVFRGDGTGGRRLLFGRQME